MRQLYSQIAVAIMAAVCAAALRWGGRSERRVAVVVALGWVATLVVQRVAGQVAPVLALMAVDGVAFALLLILTWRARTEWTVYAVALQGVTLGVHLLRLVSPDMSTWTYLTALTVAAYALLAVLAWGTWTAWRSRSISS